MGHAVSIFVDWTVLQHHPSNTGIAYCLQGFGPSYPWGLVSLSGSHMNIGVDSCWFASLEDALRNSMAWDGPNLRGLRGPVRPASPSIADLGTFSWHVQIRARQHAKGFVLAPAIDCEIPIQCQNIRGPKLVRQTNQAGICKINLPVLVFSQ